MRIYSFFLILYIFLPSFVFACNPLYTNLKDTQTKETAVFAWGRNQYGGLGNGQFSSFALPQRVYTTLQTGPVKQYYHTQTFTLIINTSNQMFTSGIDFFTPSRTMQTNNDLVPVNPSVPLVTYLSSLTARVDVVFETGTAFTTVGNTITILSAQNFSNQFIVQSATGAAFSIFLPASGRGLFAYGSNSKGELAALLKTNDSYIPTLQYAPLDNFLQNGETIVSIKSGIFHTLFYTSKNNVFGFGSNSQYELGQGYASDAVYNIVPINLGPNQNQGILSIGATSHGCLVHLKSNDIFAFGTGDNGELGSPSSEYGPLMTPINIVEGSILKSFEISQLFVFKTSSSALTKDGILISWGYNNYGQILSDSTRSRIFSPVRTDFDKLVSQVGFNEYYYLVLTIDEEFYSWGGTVPNLEDSITSRFVDLKNLNTNNVIGFAESYFATYGLIASDHSLYVWGYNSGYQLGQRGNVVIPLPTLYSPRNKNITQVICAATGAEHMVFVAQQDQQVYSFGSNYAYQLGDGTTFMRLQPIPVITNSTAHGKPQQIMITYNFNCEVTANPKGEVYCWGQRLYKYPNLIESLQSVFPLRKVYLLKDGLIAWSSINDTLWYANTTMVIPVQPFSLRVKDLHCSSANCIILSHENSVYMLGEPYYSILTATVSLEAKLVDYFESFKTEIIGVKTNQFSNFVYTKTNVYGWGINFNKVLDSAAQELTLISTPILITYTEQFANTRYQIVDLSSTIYTIHVLLERDKIVDLTGLYIALGVLGFLFIIAVALAAVTLFIIAGVVRYKRRKNRDVYQQLLSLESRSENELPLLLPSKFDCFKINFDQIQLLQEIGTGGSGALVFKAKWLNEIVAIKLFRATNGLSQSSQFDFATFEQEVELLTQLRHSNIVLFYGATLAKNRVGLVLQYCSNGSLTQFMKKKKLSLKRKVQLLIQISRALSFLHSKQIIHRDVKLDNILIDENETVKLTDFGLSKSIKEDSMMTKGVGTDHMIAPEVTLGKEYDTSADVFSLGIVMMELLIEKVNPYIEGDKVVNGIGIKVALDPTCRPRVPLDFPIQTFHTSYLLLMQECWKHENNERPSIQQVLERLEQMENELPDT